MSSKVKDLKHEVMQIDRQKERNKSSKSFSLIQDLVGKELEIQEEREMKQRQEAMELRIKKEQRERKTMMTSESIFKYEKNKGA